MSNYFTADTEQWLKERRGKITSSEYYKLTEGGRRNMTDAELKAEKAINGKRKTVDTLFGKGAISYIRRKITEIQSSEVKEEMDFKQTEWGKNNESGGADHFKQITGLSVVYHGISCPKFYPYGDFAGGSPDGEIIEEDAILELKCPYDEDVHTRRLLIKTIDQFKDEEWEAWNQCQMNMFIMKKSIAYFASFDPRRKEYELMMKIVKLKADEEWQADFKIRHQAAIELMAEILFDTNKYLIIE